MSFIVPYFVWSAWFWNTGCRPSVTLIVVATHMWVRGHYWLYILPVLWGIGQQNKVDLHGLGDLVLLVPCLYYPWPILGIIWALGTRHRRLIVSTEILYLFSTAMKLVW